MISVYGAALGGAFGFAFLTLFSLRAMPELGVRRAIALQRELGEPLHFDAALFRRMVMRHLAITIVGAAGLALAVTWTVTRLAPLHVLTPLAACVIGGAPGILLALGFPARVVQSTVVAQCEAEDLRLKPLTDEQRARTSVE